MAAECQQKNLKGLTMVAVGMNKAAEEFLILDENTREDLASGKYRDQRRGFFGSISAVGGTPPDNPPRTTRVGGTPPDNPPRTTLVGGTPPDCPPRTPVAGPARRPQPPAWAPWTQSQEKLALLYNAQGLRPGEIAAKLGVSAHLVTQIILAARNRGKS